ncbi:hypothetical protein PENSPDRAFT_28171 [Peniophora sp. CONT]|nr:hypothetical protein PENSPDRAFT_28171 [Peniophora sp. CONT]
MRESEICYWSTLLGPDREHLHDWAPSMWKWDELRWDDCDQVAHQPASSLLLTVLEKAGLSDWRIPGSDLSTPEALKYQKDYSDELNELQNTLIDGLRRLARLVSFPPIEEQVLLTDQQLEDLGIIVYRAPDVSLTPEVSSMVPANSNDTKHVLPEEHPAPHETARIENDSRSIPGPAEVGEDNRRIDSHNRGDDTTPASNGDVALNGFSEGVSQNRANPLTVVAAAHISEHVLDAEGAQPSSPELKRAEEGVLAVEPAEFGGEGESTAPPITVEILGHERLEDSSAIAPIEPKSG